MTKRIGVMGGTFDPVHIGHLMVAVTARDQLELDQVYLIPNDQSPLKEASPRASFADRKAMVQLAIGDLSGLSVSDMEGRRGGISYTVDTLTELSADHPGAELFLILGADALSELNEWKDFGSLTAMATIVGMARGDVPSPPSEFRVTSLNMPRIDISSTAIRARIAAGLSVDCWVPESVKRYIGAHRLYGFHG